MDPANRFVATVRRLKVAVIIGDATVSEVLRQARAATARAVIAATKHDLVEPGGGPAGARAEGRSSAWCC